MFAIILITICCCSIISSIFINQIVDNHSQYPLTYLSIWNSFSKLISIFYNPIEFTHENVLTIGKKQGWTDPENPSEINFNKRESYSGPIKLDKKTSRPINPVQRTGITGRGLLGKWGPNHAADPIVLSIGEDGLEIILIKRLDNGKLAIPGGMVDIGESTSVTLTREFGEESVSSMKDYEVKELLNNSEHCEIYRGCNKTDPRNTDNAWIETLVVAFFLNAESRSQLKLCAGDDATNVMSINVSKILSGEIKLYSDHALFIKKAIYKLWKNEILSSDII